MRVNVLKNSMTSVLLQIITIGMNFLTRYLLVIYVGVEWVGIDATLASLLNTFSLAELGISILISFYLYKPISKGDFLEINRIINIYRAIYQYIGCFVLLISIVFSFFVRFIITDITITFEIYIAYFVMALKSVSTYFLAYRRVLLQADQKHFVEKSVDIFFTLVCGVLQVILLLIYKSYILFLIVGVVKSIGSNIYIYKKCESIYPFLLIQRSKHSEVINTVKKLRDVFSIQVASYVYTSTDNLIISIFVNTSSVGFLSNYVFIINTIKMIIRSIMYPMTSTIGGIIAENNKNKEYIFQIYTILSYVLSGCFAAPVIVLVEHFVGNIFGRAYIMSIGIPILLVADCVLDTIMIPCCSYLSASGLFKYENRICIIGAATNIIISLLLVQNFGIIGVLNGTVVSQFVYFILRSITFYKYCIEGDAKVKVMQYWFMSIKFIITISLSVVTAWYIFQLLNQMSAVRLFVYGGLLCEIIYMFIFIIFWHKEVRKVLNVFSQKGKIKQ